MSHTAEIIAVGTEILLGDIVNTDAQLISQVCPSWASMYSTRPLSVTIRRVSSA